MNTTLHHKTIKTTTERITIRSRINRCNLITDRMRKMMHMHSFMQSLLDMISRASYDESLQKFLQCLQYLFINYPLTQIARYSNTYQKYAIFFLIQEKFFYLTVCYHMLENSKQIVNNLNVDHVQNNVELFSCTMQACNNEPAGHIKMNVNGIRCFE